jgi:O-antigen/teichoic acid export membrane protein
MEPSLASEKPQPSGPPPPDHGPPDDDVETIKHRARRGVLILAIRTVLVQLAVLGGQIALARLLDPRDFGVFAIVQFALSFFMFFGDAGLGASLIQKKIPPTQRELSSVFFVQLAISLGVVLIVVATSGLARVVWPDLPASAPWLLRALSFHLVLTTVRTIPCILMERELEFGKLAALDLIVSVTFYVVATVLAFAGWGVWALTSAVLAQGAVGFVVAYALRPFRPNWVLDRELLRPILKFGIPFQLNQVLGFANGAVTPVYAGSQLGSRPLGLINWAQNIAYFPLKLVEIVGRVAFPLYSRIQDDKALLGESFGRSVQLCSAFTAFFVALFWGMGAQVTHVVFGDKWLPALPLLRVYASAISLGFFVPLVAAALDATGRPQLLLRLSIFWTALNWVIVPLTTPRWGMLGFSMGYVVHVVVGNLAALILTSRIIPHTRLLRRVWSPILAGVGVYLLGRYVLLAAFHLAILFGVDRRGSTEALSMVPGSKVAPRPES